jgi:hypothetical protein
MHRAAMNGVPIRVTMPFGTMKLEAKPEALEAGIVEAIIVEARHWVAHCRPCDGTGYEGDRTCLSCSDMRRLLAGLEVKPNAH